MKNNKNLPIDLSTTNERTFLAAALDQYAQKQLDSDSTDVESLRKVIVMYQKLTKEIIKSSEVEVVKVQEKVEEASRDTLTGLYGRAAIKSHVYPRLESAEPSDSFFALYCDLIDLSGVNNENGHAQGDLVLKCLSEALVESTDTHPDEENDASRGVNEDFVLMRFGGDEFVVFGKGDNQKVGELTRKIAQNHSDILHKTEDLYSGSHRSLKFGSALLEDNTDKGFEKALIKADPKGENFKQQT